MAAPKGAPPTNLGDLARPDWADEAPVIVAPEEARRRVIACGVDAARITIRDDAARDETVLVIADGAALTDGQLDCAAALSLETGYGLVFGSALTPRYEAALVRLSQARGHAAARDWLARKGLLNGLRPYDPARETLAEATSRIETLCKAPAGLLVPVAGNRVTLKPGAAGPERGRSEAAQCLIQASAVAGLSMGFTGNEISMPR